MEHQESQTARPNLAVPISIFALFSVLLACELMFAVHHDADTPTTRSHAAPATTQSRNP